MDTTTLEYYGVLRSKFIIANCPSEIALKVCHLEITIVLGSGDLFDFPTLPTVLQEHYRVTAAATRVLITNGLRD